MAESTGTNSTSANSSTARILIIDDEDGIRFSLRGILEDEGHQVLEAASGEEGLELLTTNTVDLVFLDVWLPGIEGPQVLDHIKAIHPTLPVLMISGHATIETAVAAIKKGAHDFIEKPLSLEKVLISVERALEFQALRMENQALRSRLKIRNNDAPMGNSPVMFSLREQMSMVAPLDTWVLITGENGTGKEIAARFIHNNSRRSTKPLVAVNCAAIPEELIESELFGHEKGAFTGAEGAKPGRFEMAHQGTLFLDEIADMSLKTQAKILRILQEQRFERVGGNRTIHVDVRVIAATNKNLENAIAQGTFREDLYYRLRVFPLQMPPLRERGSDILELLDFFTMQLTSEHGLTPMQIDDSTRQTLLCYPWPGNVRELRNFAERMLILHGGQAITAEQLPPEFQPCREQMLDSKGTVASGVQGAKTQIIPPILQVVEDTDDLQDAIFSKITHGNAMQGAIENSSDSSDSPENGDGGEQDLYSNDFKTAKSAFEAHFLSAKLQEYNGNVSRLAEAIGLERSYLHRKLKSLNIHVTDN